MTVKPALGDNTISVKRQVRNAIELDEAFDELPTPLCDRPGHTEAAYGITELRKPGWRNSGLSRDAIGAPRSWVQTQARFEGVVDPAAFTKAVSRYAGSLSLEADLEVTDSGLGHVGGSLSGDPKLLAETVEVILDEGIHSQSAMKARLSL